MPCTHALLELLAGLNWHCWWSFNVSFLPFNFISPFLLLFSPLWYYMTWSSCMSVLALLPISSFLFLFLNKFCDGFVTLANSPFFCSYSSFYYRGNMSWWWMHNVCSPSDILIRYSHLCRISRIFASPVTFFF